MSVWVVVVAPGLVLKQVDFLSSVCDLWIPTGEAQKNKFSGDFLGVCDCLGARFLQEFPHSLSKQNGGFLQTPL